MVRAVLDSSQARGAARLLLIAIADRADEFGRGAFLTRAQLGRAAQVDERTVKRGLRELEGLGELGIVGRAKNGAPVFEIHLSGRAPVEKGVEKLSKTRGGNMPPGGNLSGLGGHIVPKGGALRPPKQIERSETDQDQHAARATHTRKPAKAGLPSVRHLIPVAHGVLRDIELGLLDRLDVHEELKQRAADAGYLYNGEATLKALRSAEVQRARRRTG